MEVDGQLLRLAMGAWLCRAVAVGDGETQCSKFRSDLRLELNKFAEPSTTESCGFTILEPELTIHLELPHPSASHLSHSHPFQRFFGAAPDRLIPIILHDGQQALFGLGRAEPSEGQSRAGTDIGMIVLEGFDQ